MNLRSFLTRLRLVWRRANGDPFEDFRGVFEARFALMGLFTLAMLTLLLVAWITSLLS